MERDSIAKRQAIAAVERLRRGETASVWPLFNQSADNSRRSYLIQLVGSAGVNAQTIVDRLKIESDPSARRALILSLGGFDATQLSDSLRTALVPTLLEWYRGDPDAGIHSAIDWLLRFGRRGATPRKLDWQQGTALSRADSDLSRKQIGQHDWFVTSQGQTMVVVRGPVQFRMGSPPDELGRMPASDSPDESLRRVHISRSFAIATKEVTVAEFQRFLDSNPEVKAGFTYPGNPNRMSQVLTTFSPESDGPQIAVTWYEAAMYCNWLSKQEGIPESDWVYPTDFSAIKSGMELPPNYLHRVGYRLPTEAEWEYAARAGTTTSLFYGSTPELLDEYAWYAKHPPKTKSDPVDPADPQRTWPVGELKPNDFGLFDIYGNVWEWTQNRMQEVFPAESEDSEDSVRVVVDTQARSRRGGAFSYGEQFQRSAERDTRNAFPMLRRDNVGFRIARTFH